jgi:hypothetical protein
MLESIAFLIIDLCCSWNKLQKTIRNEKKMGIINKFIYSSAFWCLTSNLIFSWVMSNEYFAKALGESKAVTACLVDLTRLYMSKSTLCCQVAMVSKCASVCGWILTSLYPSKENFSSARVLAKHNAARRKQDLKTFIFFSLMRVYISTTNLFFSYLEVMIH